MYYSECESPLGPWRLARKVASHPQYSFYNPIQHTQFDQNGGELIFFSGTYRYDFCLSEVCCANDVCVWYVLFFCCVCSFTFSGTSNPTPRYDYNNLMYRLNTSLIQF